MRANVTAPDRGTFVFRKIKTVKLKVTGVGMNDVDMRLCA